MNYHRLRKLLLTSAYIFYNAVAGNSLANSPNIYRQRNLFMMMISIIIPTLNEALNIGKLISFLLYNKNEKVLEIIIADGGSNDGTVDIALAAGVRAVKAPRQGRAAQMNYGASLANGDILYFIHADTLPPASYAFDITSAVNNGFNFGRYRTRFEGNRLLLKLNAFFTRFDWFVCYGGDQTLFMRKDFFYLLKGYDESLLMMEEYNLTERAKEKGRYKIMKKAAIVSIRKYHRNSWWQVQKANFIAVKMYRRGVPQQLMLQRYKEMIRQL